MLTEEQLDYVLAALDHYYESVPDANGHQHWDEIRDELIEVFG